MHQRRAPGDPRVSISCVKWPRAQDTQLPLGFVVAAIEHDLLLGRFAKNDHFVPQIPFASRVKNRGAPARGPSASAGLGN